MKRASSASVSTAISTVTTGTREKIAPVSAPCRDPMKVRESPSTPPSRRYRGEAVEDN